MIINSSLQYFLLRTGASELSLISLPNVIWLVRRLGLRPIIREGSYDESRGEDDGLKIHLL